jgi:transposase
MSMSRTFKKVNYEQALELTVRLGDCLPSDHLARFVVDSVAQLDLTALYAQYGTRGGEPYAPEVLLGLLLYGYATGVFSSRKIERATYETVPFRFIAGNLHPDHDTLATFRRTFLPELKDLFVQVLLLAKAGRCAQTGDNQPRWDQSACRCLQAQSSQLPTVAGDGGPTAKRGRGTVCPERAERPARGARWAGGT